MRRHNYERLTNSLLCTPRRLVPSCSDTIVVMRRQIVHSLLVSLEWRAIAYVITNAFFWITTGEFWKAAGYALALQVILFAAYMVWHLLRNEMHLPLVPGSLFTRISRARKRR